RKASASSPFRETPSGSWAQPALPEQILPVPGVAHHGLIQLPPKAGVSIERKVSMVPAPKGLRHDRLLLRQLGKPGDQPVPGPTDITHVGLNLADVHAKEKVTNNGRLIVGLAVQAQWPIGQSRLQGFRARVQRRNQ